MWSEASTDTQSAAHALTSQAHTHAAQSPLRHACHLRRRRGRATGIRCAVHCHPVTSILTKQRQSSRSRRGLAKTAAATALAAGVAAVVARAAPRAAGRATAGRRGLCLAHCVRQAAVARAAAATAVERRASRCRVRRWLASWRGRLVASTRAALARSARTAPLHTTVDAGAPPAGAVPGLMRRRARVGGCSEAWRELYVRLDTKSAPWSDDNGPHLVFGWRWSEGVLPHHPERTTGRSVPVGSGHHCEAAPKGTYAALISRPRAVCRARTAPTTAAKRVRKLNEGSLCGILRGVKTKAAPSC